jgi:RNA polymerase sigma-70 factor (ECF subfamily)
MDMQLIAGTRVAPVPSSTWEAFEVRASACLADCHRLASAIVGPEDAADVVQDALVQAWRNIGRLRDDDAFEPWLRTIIVNRCRNVLRARGRRPRLVELDAAARPASGHVSDPGIRVAERDRLERAFASLPVHHRAVLALRFTLDLSMRDIARSMQIPEGTARSRLNAAVTRLRAALQEDPDDAT